MRTHLVNTMIDDINQFNNQKLNWFSTVREKRMGTLIILFMLFILFEGVLRKWLLSTLGQPLIFIREPILFLIYYFYLKDYGLNKKWFLPYLIFSSVLIILSFIQGILYQYHILIPFLGLRFYILYIPLAFIMAEVLNLQQTSRLIKVLLVTSVPIALLVFIQFISPVESSINKGLSDDVEGRFTVVEGIVRPYGPFTFVAGQANWAAFLLAILILCFDNRKKLNISKKIIFLSLIPILLMGALSGARTYFVLAIIILFFYIISGLYARNFYKGIKRLVYLFLFLATFISVFIFLVPQAYESMAQRQESAVASEGSTIKRALGNIAIESTDKLPFLGHGLGAGSNMGNALRGTQNFSLGEMEWGRVFNELGIVIGSLYLFIRTLFVFILGWLALKINKKYDDGSALILFGFVGPLLLAGQITMQNQLLAICWFAVGLQLVFMKLSKEK